MRPAPSSSDSVATATRATSKDDLAGLSLDDKRRLVAELLRRRSQRETRVAPMSLGQEALWFVYRMAPDSPAYNFAFAARVAAAIDVSALDRACQALLRRHAALRTVYDDTPEGPRQRILSAAPLPIHVFEAQHWGDDVLQRHLDEAADGPFDLRHGPVLRVSVFRRGPNAAVLSLVAHHIAADLWSMDVLVHELRSLYLAELNGVAVELPPTGGKFTDFVRDEAELIDSAEGERLWQYWRQRLAGPLPTLDLPVDHLRPRRQSFRGAAHRWQLPTKTTTRLRELARRERATLFMTLLAAFETLLHRYTGQDEVLVGTATATRGRAEYDRVVGYYLNQVALRGNFAGDPTFVELLARVRDDTLGALDCQQFPLPLLVQRLQPARDPSRTPLFQAMFIWDKPRRLDAESDAARALPLEPVMMEQRGAPFDLTMIVFEIEGELTLSLRYNVELFEVDTIRRMASCFDALLTSIVANPTHRASQLSLLRDDERRRIAAALAPAADERPTPTALECFARCAAATPQHAALVQGSDVWTYAELDRRSNRLAVELRQRGVGPGNLVGVCLPRSPAAVASILAAWKVGAAHLPLDPAYPAARLEFMIEDAAPAVVVTNERLARELPLAKTQAISAETWLADGADNTGAAAQCPATTPPDAAYVIYTSGSTGRPKGVVVPQRGLANLVAAQQELLRVGTADRVLQFASLSFDASVHEIVMALCSGATLTLARQQCSLPGAGFVEQLREDRITVATLPPSTLATLPADDLPELRMVLSAGEACSAELVAKWARGREFYNAYGPTEMSVWSTAYRCSADETSAPPIGTPLRNTRAYVLDGNLALAPVGVPGELHLAGAGVANGYLNRPALSAERFVPNPFSDEFGGVLYKTGDLARLRNDGQLEFLGRIDHQVKIRGYRIEPGEVEAALVELPSIAQAFVIARDDAGQRDAALTAYVVGAGDDRTPNDRLRAALAGSLPPHMVPSVFVWLDSLPLSPNGKVDRTRLPAPSSDRPELAQSYTAPRNEVERRLADIWQRVLGLDRVGVHDNFFDLGGASLQTLRVVEAAAAVGLEIKPETLFEHQSIAELASAIAVGEPPASAAPLVEEVRLAAISTATPKAAIDPIIARRPALAERAMVIESLGVYLPDNAVSTADIVQGCRKPLDFPLERMSGIVERRMAEGEFSIDLARAAVRNCLERSRFAAGDVDLLICANISRCDGPGHRFSYEPSTAARLRHEFGMQRAMAFDLSNACAGVFTALSVAEAALRTGAVGRAMIVSGEYITHLTRTAQQEIDGFMDPRLACLTLGDAGVAITVDLADRPGVGFEALDMYTLGRYSQLCVAKVTDRSDSGAVMLTDPVKATATSLRQSVMHAQHVLGQHKWTPDDVDWLVLHQTSETTLDGAVAELNRQWGREVCSRNNTLFNIARRGNTATTTHFVALADALSAGRIQSGERIVFGISGSGQTTGIGLYRLDDLPDRWRARPKEPASPLRREPSRPCVEQPRIRVVAADLAADATRIGRDSLALVVNAAEQCLSRAGVERGSVDLLIHAGVYRAEYLSEPAMAALCAGELAINADIESPNDPKTLAFDIMSGAAGSLAAAWSAAEMLRSGQRRRALVVASEIENNADAWPDNLLGIEEAGSAMLLEPTSPSGEGFGRFLFRTFGEHVDAQVTYTTRREGRPALAIERSPDLAAIYRRAIRDTVAEFLASERVSLDDLSLVITPFISPKFDADVLRDLGIGADRGVLPLAGKGDYFTSGLAAAFVQIRDNGRARAGGKALVITVGSGVQVGCAMYHFTEAQA